MNINRHNYEEFFLLYVDNELTAAQRTEVEVFVQQNPDLTEELAMLQGSVLTSDNFTFSNKEILYKDEHSININNYEEYFLLDVDNELPASKKMEVEKFVLQHPELQDEFTTLHQTKLQPEVIEFKDKSVLYRSEKERRVIPMTFMRFAVAASMIGLMAALWFVYPGKVETSPPLASTEKRSVEVQTGDKEPITVEEPIKLDKAATKQTLVAATTPPSINKNPATILSTNVPAKNAVVEQQQPKQLIAQAKPEEIVLQENYTAVTNSTTPEPELAINISNKNVDNPIASSARPAVYKEVDTDDEDNSFYIGFAEINKNKLRGLIKKVTNLFDKKSRDDDSEKTIRIASFEIKTK